MVRCPAPLALATNAFPMASVVSARRTMSSVGSRIWVRPQSPHLVLRPPTAEKPGRPDPRVGSERPAVLPQVGKSRHRAATVSYTHLRAHETDSYLVCRLL